MASPIAPGRQYPRPPRRPAAGILAGLAAAALLLVLVIGVPVALAAVLGSPIPHSMPSLSMLTHRLDILAVLKILSLVVWLAWLQLIWCVAAEVRAAVRNTGMPSRVPLAGGIQPAVHRLVTATLLLFSAGAVLSPAYAQQVPRAPQVVSAAPLPGPGAQAASGVLPLPGHDATGPGPGRPAVAHPEDTSTALLRMRRMEKFYVVQPPEGRYHESLWEIAQNHLGDGRRYREIFELNAGHPQPDGSRLTIASLIRPGWILRMPKDAYGPGIRIVTLHEHPGGHSAGADHDGADHDRDDARRSHGAGGPGGVQHSPAPQRPAPSPAHSPSPPRRSMATPGPGTRSPGRPSRGPVRTAAVFTFLPAPASPLISPNSQPLRCWPRGCSRRSGAAGGGRCGTAGPAGGWPRRGEGQPRPRRRCGWEPMSRRRARSTPACAICRRRWPGRTGRCRRSSRPMSAASTWTCGSHPPTGTRPPPG